MARRCQGGMLGARRIIGDYQRAEQSPSGCAEALAREKGRIAMADTASPPRERRPHRDGARLRARTGLKGAQPRAATPGMVNGRAVIDPALAARSGSAERRA